MTMPHLMNCYHKTNSWCIPCVKAEWERREQELRSRHVNAFRLLALANAARQEEWDPHNKITLIYRSNELGGETGEACNVIKKLERERLGIRGSRATKEQLADELADVIICASLIANNTGIDLWEAVVAKFNKTSVANYLRTMLVPVVRDS